MSPSLNLGFVNINTAWLRSCPMWQLRLAFFLVAWLPLNFRTGSFWVCVIFLFFYGFQAFYLDATLDVIIGNFPYMPLAAQFSLVLLVKHLKKTEKLYDHAIDYRLRSDLASFSKKIRLAKISAIGEQR